jgi:hypothetical protein
MSVTNQAIEGIEEDILATLVSTVGKPRERRPNGKN